MGEDEQVGEKQGNKGVRNNMENTPETIKPAPPINITEDIQVSLNRLGRDLETHAESGIRIGKNRRIYEN